MSKQQVSVFMGDTGANTAADARTNLGALSTAGETISGTKEDIVLAAPIKSAAERNAEAAAASANT